jgi:hypothetical protein
MQQTTKQPQTALVQSDIAQAFATPVECRGLPISVRWTASGEEPLIKTAGNAAPPGEPQLQRRHMQSFLLEINPAALTVDAADNNHIKLEVVAVALDLESMSARPGEKTVDERLR